MRALLGVSDRSGLVELASGLAARGVELIATDGTRRALAAAGIEARSVAEVTGSPEMLGGRVKTLHPAIHAGILARRDSPEQMAELEEQGFVPIDMVVVNLYPFEAALARGAGDAELIENIDIGGPTLIRAAAKNSASVTVVVSPARYGEVLIALAGAGVDRELRTRLAAEAFAHVAAYDTAVAGYLSGRTGGSPAPDGGEAPPEATLPPALTTGGRKLHDLRYGENPHQRGALYAVAGTAGLAMARRLQGAELSFTNWLDADAAWRIVSDFEEPAAVVVKHTNPCGFATGQSAADAYRRAYECDPRSAFGGVVGLNRALDAEVAEELGGVFLELVVAPAVDDAALGALSGRPRLRLLAVELADAGHTGEHGAPRPTAPGQLDVRSIGGGLLVQTADRPQPVPDGGTRVPTRVRPDDGQWSDLRVAWRLCRHVKSNAIVIVRDGMAVGVGAGQMSRVEAAELAVARSAGRSEGAAAASDAFFPMPDGVEALAAAGVATVIQPGGSRRDGEVVAAADAAGMAMVLTGERHFRH